MKNGLFTTLPGTRDILPDETSQWQYVEDLAHKMFARYGFVEIRTPLLEATELFARGIGGDTDIVQKEMYTFLDQGGVSMTLRPEATASVVRAYLEHHLHRGGGVTKLYYLGPMFRRERKQKGRWRQFTQIGAEVLGTDHPAVEAEAIEMLLGFFEALGIKSRLLVNSVGCQVCRPVYVASLKESLAGTIDRHCEDCRRRAETNSLRVLDCKVETCQPLIERLPKITDYLCTACSGHFASFIEHLKHAGMAFEAVPRLVRGLDYYVRTAFELVSGDLGAQNALAGGGRYDGLAAVLGGPDTKGFGFALGVDRLVMVLPPGVRESSRRRPDVYLTYLSGTALREVISVARAVRREGFSCQFEFEGGSLKSQMRQANKSGARHVVIVGGEELVRSRFSVKRMDDSRQWDVSLQELIDYLRSLPA